MQGIDKKMNMMDITLECEGEGQYGRPGCFFFLIAWGIWYRRNKMVHDKLCVEPKQVIEYALSMLKIHKELKDIPSTVAGSHPGPQGYLKLNIDGAILFFDQHKAGVGVILRDENEDIVMAASKLENDFNDPETIEVLAMFRVLQLCANIYWHL